MSVPYGSQSMVDPLRRVLVKRPDSAYAVENHLKWHYTAKPDLEEARREHDAFVSLLEAEGVEVSHHDEPQPGRADSIFTYDPAIVTDRGAIILSMGKQLRRGEEGPMARRLEKLGVPIIYRVHGDARAEGGDCLWLDHDTLAVGQGFRTNAEGLRQLREALHGTGVEIIPVPLPYFYGPEACLHLMSLISLVDHDLAVAYPSLLPVPFWRALRERGIDIIEVPEAEFDATGTNVLAIAPRVSLMLEGNPVTERALGDAGCRVLTYKGDEITLKSEGGPTCLTRPLLRRA
ncbi:MAG: arginine deiminase family protein [Candidatus Bathyarchaeia archaeon]